MPISCQCQSCGNQTLIRSHVVLKVNRDGRVLDAGTPLCLDCHKPSATTLVHVTVEPYACIDGIDIINICHVIDKLFGDDWWRLDSGLIDAGVKAYMEMNDCHGYAAPREFFNLNSAVQEAARKGKSRVVVEDLS